MLPVPALFFLQLCFLVHFTNFVWEALCAKNDFPNIATKVYIGAVRGFVTTRYYHPNVSGEYVRLLVESFGNWVHYGNSVS